MGRVSSESSRRERAVEPYARNGGSRSGGGDGTRVYVGNLSWEVRWQSLKVTANNLPARFFSASMYLKLTDPSYIPSFIV